MFVELQRDHLGRIVPGDRLQTQRRTIRSPRDHAEKGVEIALRLAEACQEIPFVFVKGWPLSFGKSLALRRQVRRLKNVELIERLDDMRLVYENCRVLLVPSKWGRETWGRVASEAQVSGIPVIGSDIGGLPEAVGRGGVIIEANASINRSTRLKETSRPL